MLNDERRDTVEGRTWWGERETETDHVRHSCMQMWTKQRGLIIWTCWHVRSLITEFRGGRAFSEERFTGLFDLEEAGEWREGGRIHFSLLPSEPYTIQNDGKVKHFWLCTAYSTVHLPLRSWLKAQVQSNTFILLILHFFLLATVLAMLPAWLYGWQCWLVRHIEPDWNITIEWISMKYWSPEDESYRCWWSPDFI